ncbi:MAG: hypothetical protein U5K79_04760 [Cyclobacteriaceae bacterium]|nr:hypothetical protein [Cyclobacteriaceae bacterium]
MKGLTFLLVLIGLTQNPSKERVLHFEGSEVRTTYEIEGEFYGMYKGSKPGYLELRADGTGTYRYDYSALMKSCEGTAIDFDWGFLLDDQGTVVRFERPYGYSYPIIYSCTGNNTFRNCTMTTMIDYILVYNTGVITVSSSDDWKKVPH